MINHDTVPDPNTTHAIWFLFLLFTRHGIDFGRKTRHHTVRAIMTDTRIDNIILQKVPIDK